MWNLQKQQPTKQTNPWAHRYRELIRACQRQGAGGGWGGEAREMGEEGQKKNSKDRIGDLSAMEECMGDPGHKQSLYSPSR